MTARDYAVRYPYGMTTGYWSPTRPHRGADRPAPLNTPIVIGGTTIGWTGATGEVTAPHLHTQAGTDLACQNTINPAPFEFQPGVVVALRNTNVGQWGKYVTLKVGQHYVTYAHLNQVNVTLGQSISAQAGEPMINHGDVTNLFRLHLGREPDAGAYTTYVNKPWHEVYYAITNSQEYANRQRVLNEQANNQQVLIQQLQQKNDELQAIVTQEALSDAEMAGQLDKAHLEIKLLTDKLAAVQSQTETIKASGVITAPKKPKAPRQSLLNQFLLLLIRLKKK